MRSTDLHSAVRRRSILPVPQQPEPATYRLGSGRFVLPVALVLGVIVAVGFALRVDDEDLRILMLACCVPFAVAAMVLAGQGLRGGVTEVGHGGMVLAAAARKRPDRIRWADITEVRVQHYVFERRLRVRVRTRRGDADVDAHVLAGPRDTPFSRDRDFGAKVDNIQRWWATANDDAIVEHTRNSPLRIAGFAIAFLLASAMVVVTTQTWNSPWWPGVHEASGLPNACDVLGGDLVARAVGGPRRSRTMPRTRIAQPVASGRNVPRMIAAGRWGSITSVQQRRRTTPQAPQISLCGPSPYRARTGAIWSTSCRSATSRSRNCSNRT